MKDPGAAMKDLRGIPCDWRQDDRQWSSKQCAKQDTGKLKYSKHRACKLTHIWSDSLHPLHSTPFNDGRHG